MNHKLKRITAGLSALAMALGITAVAISPAVAAEGDPLCYRETLDSPEVCEPYAPAEWSTTSTLPPASPELPYADGGYEETTNIVWGENVVAKPDSIIDASTNTGGAWYVRSNPTPQDNPFTLETQIAVKNNSWASLEVVGVEGQVLKGSDWAPYFTDTASPYVDPYAAESSVPTTTIANGTYFTSSVTGGSGVASAGQEAVANIEVTFPHATFTRNTVDSNGVNHLNAFGYEGLITLKVKATTAEGAAYIIDVKQLLSRNSTHLYDYPSFVNSAECVDTPDLCGSIGADSFTTRIADVPRSFGVIPPVVVPTRNNIWVPNTCSVDAATNDTSTVSTTVRLKATNEYLPLAGGGGIVYDPTSYIATYLDTNGTQTNAYRFHSDIFAASYADANSTEPTVIDLSELNVVETRVRAFEVYADATSSTGFRVAFTSEPITLNFPYNGSSTALDLTISLGGEGGGEVVSCSLATTPTEPPVVTPPVVVPPVVTPPTPEVPAVPETPTPVTPKVPVVPETPRDDLASTGFDGGQLGFLAAGIMLLGAALVAVHKTARRTGGVGN